MNGKPNFTLPLSSQGHPRVIIINTNFVKLESAMIHSKIKDHLTYGSEKEGI